MGKNHGWCLVHQRAGEDSGDEALFSDEGHGGRKEDMGGLVEEVVSVAIVPGSDWDLLGGTDEDSDQEEEPSGHGKRLPRNLLTGEATVSHRRQNQAGARARPQLGEEEDTQEEEPQEKESQEKEEG